MIDYKYKTDPFDHQHERFLLYRDREAHAHLWEQRTGKSKITIDTMAYQHSRGNITGALVIAPNGVHLNWVKNEIPTHMPEYTGCEAFAYESTPKAMQKKELERLMKTTSHGLRVLSMNIEAIRTPKGFAFAKQFLQSYRSMLTIDEGSIIKTFNASQTEAVLKLAGLAPIRRLLNGTPVTQSPLDIFPQFTFLDPHILRTSSWYAFRNRYAILETQGQMKRFICGKLDGIAGKLGSYSWGPPILSEENGVITAGQQPMEDGRNIDFILVQKKMRTLYDLNWSIEGKHGGTELIVLQPGDVYTVIAGYQKLDELKALIDPHSDRVLKVDCLDLPEKVYQKRYVPLSTKQQQMYNELKRRSLVEVNGKFVTASNALVKMLRLQQIIGGFYVPDESIQLGLFEDNNLERIADNFADLDGIPIDKVNPRIESLLEDIEQTFGKVLIWARFKSELRAIAKALREKYGPDAVGEAHGGQKSEQRQITIDLFREAELPRFLVANPAAKGVSRGQNLCSAATEHYYSNSFSLEDRLQSEDRPHSPGQKNNLGVIDWIAPDTLDEKVVQALRDKKELADMITGDKLINWI